MPREFWRATAEAVVSSIDAVVAISGPATATDIASFAQLTQDQANSALSLAVDLGLLEENASKYQSSSPLCSSFATAYQERRAAALRLVLEEYEPFVRFRERLLATQSASTAAAQVKMLLDLDVHQEDVKDTLLSLGQYARALEAQGGGAYSVSNAPTPHPLEELLAGCADDVSAERLLRAQIGLQAVASVSRDDVLLPLGTALQRASAGDARGAVLLAGNAIESFLVGFGAPLGTPLDHLHGIGSKADHLRGQNQIPAKLLAVAKYLGAIRNAADHGVDPDIGVAWQIRPDTAINYVFVSCSFIAALFQRQQNGPPEI